MKRSLLALSAILVGGLFFFLDGAAAAPCPAATTEFAIDAAFVQPSTLILGQPSTFHVFAYSRESELGLNLSDIPRISKNLNPPSSHIRRRRAGKRPAR